MSRPEFRAVRRTIYALKRKFPQGVTLVRAVLNSVNYQTGVKTSTQESKYIKRAVLLPPKLTRNFSYDLAYIADNKNYTYGAYYDSRKRNLLISKRDLGTFLLDLDAWLFIGSKRYEVESVTEFEEGEAFIVSCTATEGAPGRAFHVSASDSLVLGESASAVVA